MKKLGVTDPKWSLKEAIKKQIEVEDRVVFSQQPQLPIHRYAPRKFELTSVAKHAFTRGISLFKL